MQRVKTNTQVKSSYKKVLTRYQLVLYGISNTIGAGIFALTGIAAQYTGPSLVFSFLIAGAMCLTTAMMYAELCARFPSNGSGFAYVYATFGEFAAWIVGWNVLPFYGATASGLCRALAIYISRLFSKFGVTLPQYFTSVPVFGFDCNPLAPLLMFAICMISVQGTEASTKFNSALTLAKLVALGFIIIVAFSQFEASNLTPVTTEEYGWQGTVLGSTILFFAMIGFDFISTISEEAINTQRDAPIAMRETVVICTVVYCFVAVSLSGMGLGRSESYVAETAMADQFNIVGLNWMSLVIYICAVLGIAASLLTNFMGTVRLVQSFARDGLLPQLFNESNPDTGIPTKNCYIVLAVLAYLALLYDLEALSLIVSLANLLVFSFVQACGISYRYRRSANESLVKGASIWVWYYLGLSFVSSFLLTQGVWWVFTALSLMICAAVLLKITTFEQVNLPIDGAYTAPFVPVLPAVGIYFNFVLAWEATPMTWVNMALYSGVGAGIYFGYGINHARLE